MAAPLPMELVEIAAANLLLCSAIAWGCICRLNSERSRKNLWYRAKYVVLLTGASGSGLSPVLFGRFPDAMGLGLSSVVLLWLILDTAEALVEMYRTRKHGGTYDI